MSLQKLISDVRNGREDELDLYNSIVEHQNTLLNNPKLLRELDSETVTTILRESVFQSIDKVIKLIAEHAPDLVNPLDLALFQGNVELTESLLKSGKKFEDSKWGIDYHPGVYIFMKKNKSTRVEMLKLLDKFGCLGFRNEDGYSFLHLAAHISEADAVEIAEILINAGISPDVSDHEGYKPLLNSIPTACNMDFIKFLLKNGADVNQRNEKTNVSLLSTAVRWAEIDVIDLLVSNGATDVNERARSGIGMEPGRTALHLACYYHHEKLIKDLICKGADVTIEDNISRTPFSYLDSAYDHYDECVIVMLKQFSKLSYENFPVSKSDLNLIKLTPEVQEKFEMCKIELDKMANTKLYRQFSFYSLIKNLFDTKKLANLLKNTDFVSTFKDNLSTLSFFKNDLQDIFEEAVQIKKSLEIVEERLFDIFGDYLPRVVIRILGKSLTTEDLPTE